MGSFFERLFGKKEPEVFSVSMGAIPSWLEGREKTARSVLDGETRQSRQKIRDGIRHLQQVTGTLARAEQEEEIHPKLRSIAKNSLPQFVKSMNAALGREMPDDIEEFYSAAAECLKASLNSTRGQGRYLQAVFPEEMKTIKSGIDAVGHEINAMTASLARYRKERNHVGSALAIHTALLDISADLGKAEEKERRIGARIAEIGGRITAIGAELDALAADERKEEVALLEAALAEAEERRNAVVRTNAAMSMTASHVFRKAEKIATRQKHPSEIAVLQHAMELLSDHDVPDTAELAEALAAACPIAGRMIAAEEITLKNREERAVFSDTVQFTADICASCSDLGEQEEACRVAGERAASHPLTVKIHALGREKDQLGTMLAKENLARDELSEWVSRTREKIPGLKEELVKRLGDMTGGGVQLQIDDPRLA